MFILFIPLFFVFIGYPLALVFALISGASLFKTRRKLGTCIYVCTIPLALIYWSLLPNSGSVNVVLILDHWDIIGPLYFSASLVLIGLMALAARHFKKRTGAFGSFGKIAITSAALIVLYLVSTLIVMNLDMDWRL